MFFENPIEGYDAIYLNEILKAKLDFSFEFFPKQPVLNEKRKYGNLIKLPLGEHKKYNQRSKFFTFEKDQIIFLESVENNLALIEKTVKVTKNEFLETIESFKTTIKYDSKPFIKVEFEPNNRKLYIKNLSKLFNGCNAINRLKVKAHNGEALSHLELFHLVNTMLSLKDTKDDIHNLIRSSFKKEYSYKITKKELSLLRKLQPANCKTLINQNICKGYCKPEFKKRNEDESLRNTSPLHSQIPIVDNNKGISSATLLENICELENIRLAYYRLREYHKNEDALFYDEFDFEFFENDFDTNIQQVSLMIKNKVEIPFIEYEKVTVPKKLDEKGEMVTRGMAYSSVFDQVIVQAIFNVIGGILESNFENSSYGYRLNVNNKNSYNIFEDWRDKYPSFRNNVLNKLREPDIN